jgi:hypothetical protein
LLSTLTSSKLFAVFIVMYYMQYLVLHIVLRNEVQNVGFR